MDPYVTIYSGTEITILHLKDLLEQEDIPVIVQDDFSSGIMAGFYGGTPSTVRLKVKESDFERSASILREALQERQE